MKSRKLKPLKKAKYGEDLKKDSKGNYTYTRTSNRPEGKRIYQASSIDPATAMKMTDFKARNNPADSISRTTLSPEMLKKLGMKKGGTVKVKKRK
jgi:NADH dehydrogenase/NADH:ubiquinone oxidoreductase subunit G